MTRLALLDTAFFALETPTRPMHAGALMLFDPPDGEPGADFAGRVVDAFRGVAPVSPFDRRPVLTPGLTGRFPHWVTVHGADLDYHVRRIALPGPGTPDELMALVGHLYVALLDRSRPLWECYVIDGLESGQIAVFYKLHHALADGISGARMLFGALSDAADDPAITPLWGPRKAPRRRRERDPRGRSALAPLTAARRQAEAAVGIGSRLVKLVPAVAGIRSGARAVPFSAPRLASGAQRQSPARSFAIFDLSLSEVKAVADQAGGSVNDVVLTVCDHAMQRYLAENDDAVTRPLVASMAVSTRGEGDQTPSNAAVLTQVRLGAPDASLRVRLAEVIRSTTAVKAEIRGSSKGALELESLAFLGAAHLREELPLGRGVLPPAANMLISNIPGGPKEPLYMSGGRLAGIYAAPIVPPAHAVNFTLASYADTLCFGVGAARNVIPDTGRIAKLALESFEQLAREVAPASPAKTPA